jgi:agmatine/peptidylarginine deiminase
MDNLVTLCQSCHGKEEPRYTDLERKVREVSKVNKAHSKSMKFLKLTIPRRIAHRIGLSINDFIEWESYTDKNGEVFARIRKLK